MSSTYRNLLLKASIHVKTGLPRSLITAILGVIILIWSLYNSNWVVAALSPLFFIIAWLYYTIHTFSKEVFKALEELNEQIESFNDQV